MTTTIRARQSWPNLPWDDGVTWFTRRTVAPTEQPVSTSFIYEKVLRGADLSDESEYVEALIVAATQQAEAETGRALMPQTWEQVLSGFPASGQIVLEYPPLIEVTSLSYYDTAGDAQELAVSPAEFLTVPSGAYSKAIIRPLAGESFPSTYAREDAVTVTYRAGYEDTSDPVLQMIVAGIGLFVGEVYKNRSLSVHAVHNTPSVLNLKTFWRQVFG